MAVLPVSMSGEPMTRRGILTGGTWCIDRNLLVDNWPAENGRADIVEAEMSGGGSACNMAIDIKRLDPDMPVATIGLVGDDADGRFLVALADRYGIDRSRMTLTDRAETDYFGTSHLLTPDHFDFTGTGHRIFHLGLPGVHRLMDGPWHGEANGWVATLRKARSAGLRTNLELASIAPDRLAAIVRPCLPYLDTLVVNDSEIAGIAGIETVSGGKTDPTACVAAAKETMARGAMQLAAVHFPGGAIVATRDGAIVSRPSARVPAAEIAGANGAGDAFAAGFLYALHEDWGIEDALALAHATAAASLRRISTTGAVETWAECLKLADAWGWRETLQ